MNILKLLKLSRLLKDKNIKSDQLLNFVSSLNDNIGLPEATQFVEASQKAGVISKSVRPEADMSPEEIAVIKREIKQDLFKTIQKELFNLLKVKVYASAHAIERDGVVGIEYIYNKDEEIKNLSPTLRHIVEDYGQKTRFGNTQIHPTIYIEEDFSPDTIIDSFNVSAQHIFMDQVRLEKDCTSTYEEVPQFNKLMKVAWEQEAVFFKDISFLQIFAHFGLDDLIEKSIIYGADIGYREKTQNKTALEMYNPNPSNAPALTAYITSLLDGTYNNGHYQAMYEKKKLESMIEAVEKNSEKVKTTQFKL